jgi:subtilisin-like proprotein convertase family protein
VVDVTGELKRGDDKLDNGEFFDFYEFEVAVGDIIQAEVRAGSFDTYVGLRRPSGGFEANDDFEGRKDYSRLLLTADEPGIWALVVTSYGKKEKGDYSAVVTIWSAAPAPQTVASTPASQATGQLLLDLSGRLGSGDATLDNGEYVQLHTFQASVGDVLTADLYSTDFDTYVGLAAPGGDISQNDDFNGSKGHSRVVVASTEAGEWSLVVTSYKAGETGAFTATVSVPSVEGSSAANESGDLHEKGELAKGDPTLNGGEYYDTYDFIATQGEQLTAVVTSHSFDTYVVLKSPSGEVWGNDDFENRKDRSEVTVEADQSGEWMLVVTSYKSGERGAYETTLTRADTAPQSTSGDSHSGTLASGDETLDSGEYVDTIELKGRAGEHVVIDLRGEGFDTYLGLRSPSGEIWQNDDHESSSARSQLSLELPETGTYTVIITSYKAAETGPWQLAVTRADAESADTGARQERGTLDKGDTQLESGEYVDIHTFEGLPGQHVRLDVASSDFDTYMVLIHPDGGTDENDDSAEESGHSLIDVQLTEAGTYMVAVTSYKAGETGDYVLHMTLDDGHQTADTSQRDVTRLSAGTAVQGRLEQGDALLEGGEFQDVYTFDGVAGQGVSVQLSSSDFDTYVGLQLPTGEFIENDDWESRSDLSRIDLELPESGRYRVVATSYSPGVTGSYKLVMNTVDGSSVQGASSAGVNQASGEVYGVFIGISDYPGENNDLAFTADDARILQRAFVNSTGLKPENGIVLTDAQATVGAMRSAMAQIGQRMGPDDRFVFFFSGHGVRVPRKGEYQTADPDGQDETLALYDGMITDDEFSVLLDDIPGTSLIVLDACFSGGFAKDIISQPGRMGLFSSQEDVTSAVAAKFRAGGYLARFMADAIGEKLADDGDGQLTALELSQYIYDRYRTDVKVMTDGPPAVVASTGDKAAPQLDYVLTSRNLGYQQLVVDRGGVNPYQVLFSW